MNMSLYEMYLWFSHLEFPSIAAIWTWLITVPWWVASITIAFTAFVIKFTWKASSYFYRWFSDWSYDAGEWLGDPENVLRRHTLRAIEVAKMMKRKIYHDRV